MPATLLMVFLIKLLLSSVDDDVGVVLTCLLTILIANENLVMMMVNALF